MYTQFSENRMLARRSPREGSDAPPAYSEAPKEKGFLAHLNRNKGKYLLGLAALLGGGYGLGRLGAAGTFHDGTWFARNMPARLTSGFRHASAQSTRFSHVVDGLLRRQTPTDANSALQIRENIIKGSGGTRPHEIS